MGFISDFLGSIMNFIYEALRFLSIESVGFSIIMFTIVVYTLMLPLTIKQQKFTRVSAIMNPEIQAIQKKYKGKNDQASMMKMQEEMKLVYAKYGTSPMGGCLGSLIQLPILFALWPVISNISKYIVRFKGAENVLDFKNANKFLFFDSLQQTPKGLLDDSLKPLAIGMVIAAIAIPVLSGLTQWINMKVSQVNSPQPDPNKKEEGGVASSMNGFMKFMPILSVVMCFAMPIGLGIYWIVSAVVRTIQQVVINKVLDKKPIEKLIEENIKKAAKKEAKKQGYTDDNHIDKMAKTYAKRLEDINKDNEKFEKREKTHKSNKTFTNPASGSSNDSNSGSYKSNAKPGSLASKANLVSDYNNRNNK